jgi:hypothetical protein
MVFYQVSGAVLWKQLVAYVDPVLAAHQGYSDIYIDQNWLNRLTPDQMSLFTDQDCVKLVERLIQKDSGIRLLYDIRACKEVIEWVLFRSNLACAPLHFRDRITSAVINRKETP